MSEDVYERIFQAIISGVLPSGTILHEVSLARQLNVSRTPVHEALRRLAADGMVEHLATRRARVAMFSRQTLREIYELRKLLEQAATERAAERLTPEQLAELLRQAREVSASKDDAEFTRRALAFDLTFHDTLASACGNEHLRKEISKYRRLVQAFCRITGTPEILRAAFAEHMQILAAIEKRDGALAGARMAAHIDARMNKVLQSMSDEKAAVASSSQRLVSA